MKGLVRDFSGGSIFFDDCIFLYAYSTHPLSDSCTRLLQRTASGECEGYSTHEVVEEFLYKAVLAEASRLAFPEASSTSRLLKKHSDLLSSLVGLYRLLEDILSLKNLTLLDTSDIKKSSEELAVALNLFHSDALSAACCRAHGISNIATTDRHFEKVDFLTVWSP